MLGEGLCMGVKVFRSCYRFIVSKSIVKTMSIFNDPVIVTKLSNENHYACERFKLQIKVLMYFLSAENSVQ